MQRARLIVLPQDNPLLAGVRVLAAIGYPEPRHDVAHGHRDKFSGALIQHKRQQLLSIGAGQAAEALDQLAAELSPSGGDFEQVLERGVARAHKSVCAYILDQRRQIVAITRVTGASGISACDLNRAVPSWTETVRNIAAALIKYVALNVTGPASDERTFRVKELQRRLLRAHSPALPLVHGVIQGNGPPANPSRAAIREWMLEALDEPSVWLIPGVQSAQQDRERPYLRGGEPELMPERLLLPVWSGAGSIVLPNWLVELAERPTPRPPHERRSPKRAANPPENAPVTAG